MVAFDFRSFPGAPEPATETPATAIAPGQDRLPQWHSVDLLAGAAEARITHGDTVYRLRLTQLGKLILTK